MSRDKFEALVSENLDIDTLREMQFAKVAWLAGRESMRDEATNTARFFAKNSATARSIVEAIKSIEP